MDDNRNNGLADLRRQSGVSATDAAKLMAVAPSAVSRIESGRHRTRLSTLAAYYAAVGRHDLMGSVARLPGNHVDSDALDAAMRWEARFGAPRQADPTISERLSGRIDRVRAQAAMGVADRSRLLRELEDLAMTASFGGGQHPGPDSQAVMEFLGSACLSVSTPAGLSVADSDFIGRRELARAYRTWATGAGRVVLGERHFLRVVDAVPGVVAVRRARDGLWGFGLLLVDPAQV